MAIEMTCEMATFFARHFFLYLKAGRYMPCELAGK